MIFCNKKKKKTSVDEYVHFTKKGNNTFQTLSILIKVSIEIPLNKNHPNVFFAIHNTR